MNIYTFLLLFSASAVFASFSSDGTTNSERTTMESFEDDKTALVPVLSFNVQIRNDLVNRFDHGLLVNLIADEDHTFLNHLKYLVENDKRLAISQENYKAQIINALAALASSYKLQVHRQELDLIPLKAEIEKIKKRILKIRKRGLKALEDTYKNKIKIMEQRKMKLSKIEAFVDYCNLVGEDRCFKVVSKNSPISEDEFVKIE